MGSVRVVATRCIPRCHHGLLSHRARSFRDEADVCPRRMRTKGERCPSPSSASSSWRFRTAELFPAERRPDNLDLSHLLGRSVSCGGAEPLGSILTHTPVLWTNAEPGAQQSLLTAGLATPRRDRMRFAALRRCGAVEERDMRPRDACQTRSLGIGPFGGAGKGSTPLAAQRRATFSFGWVLSLRVPVAGQPRLVSPFIVSAPPSAAHAFGNPACLRGRAGDVGAGRRGLLSGIWEFEAAAPPVGGDPLCCRPGDNDSRRVPCSW